MSQTVARPAAAGQAGRTATAGRAGATPVVPVQAAAASGRSRERRGRLGRALENTPGRMRVAAVTAVLVCLVFAALGGNAFRARGAALDQARDDAAQLVRVQQIAIDTTKADALVTSAFLQGSGEPAGTVASYQRFVTGASTGLTDAARAQPGDSPALGEVNDALSRYTAAVAAARANNRQGYQVGSGYLRQASNLLRVPAPGQAAALPTLSAVATADAARAGDAFDAARNATFQLVAAGLVVLAGLLAVQVWLARRTRRILNVPLTWGTAAVLACLVLGLVVLLSDEAGASRVRSTHYAAARALSQARIDAFDARANENLTLVYQGGGSSFETDYQQRLAAARQEVATARSAGATGAGAAELAGWSGGHAAIRALDDAGNWAGAVQRATGPSQRAFDAFDSTSESALGAQAKAVDAGLGDRHWLLVALGWLTLVAGLAAAGAAARGLAQRLGEYR